MAKVKVDYPASAAQIVELVGGKENISKVTHCVTRVRFQLKDADLARANTEAIQEVPGVIQVVDAGGQFQVVIGTTVVKMYDEVVAITGNAGGEVPEDDGQPEVAEKLNPFQKLIKVISGIMLPNLGALTGCGIIASLSTLLMVLGIAPEGSDTYTFLYNVGQSCLYFFPVIIGSSAAKYFGMDRSIGAIIGAALMYPVVINPDIAGTTAHVFGILPVTYQAYSATVFPAMAAVAFGALVNKWLKKVIPDMVNFFCVPALTLLITLPVSFAAIAPVMTVLSNLLTSAIMAVYNLSPIVAGIVLNALWLPSSYRWACTKRLPWRSSPSSSPWATRALSAFSAAFAPSPVSSWPCGPSPRTPTPSSLLPRLPSPTSSASPSLVSTASSCSTPRRCLP